MILTPENRWMAAFALCGAVVAAILGAYFLHTPESPADTKLQTDAYPGPAPTATPGIAPSGGSRTAAKLPDPSRPPPGSGSVATGASDNPNLATATLIHRQLQSGYSAPACAEAQTGILELIQKVPENDPLWSWVLDRAHGCLRAPGRTAQNRALLDALAKIKPDHPRIRELLGLDLYDRGKIDQAASALDEALKDEPGTFEGWVSLADARLSEARALIVAGAEADAIRTRLLQAETAAQRALELAGPEVLPFALHTLAQVHTELGQSAEAIQWADRALEALRAGSAQYQTYMAAELHLFVGQTYYRAGQRDTGLAFMDQGIGMAPLAQQQADLRRIREEFLRRYP